MRLGFKRFVNFHRITVFLFVGALPLWAGCGAGSVEQRVERRPYVSLRSNGFTNFETEPVRPLALAAEGRYLFALNTADDRLEIFDTRSETLRSIGETTVGLRPVALALRGSEAWVVNHLSDSVTVVDVRDPHRPRVLHTLQVGDEPRGIVVGGPRRDRIFVASARREQTLTPGVGRAQIWIFDARRPLAPPRLLTLLGAKPRALGVSADGRFLYAAVFRSGNGTTTVSGEDAIKLGRAPRWSLSNIPYSSTPKQGAIVRQSVGKWLDASGRDWSAAVPFELPDHDLFVIDVSTDEPRIVNAVSNIGTMLFNLAVQPGSGEIWITNTEAFNFMPHEPRLRGKFAANRVTRVVAGAAKNAQVQPIDLNRHIDRSKGSATDKVRELSLAQPLDIVFSPDGLEVFVAAFGSSKVALLDRTGNVIERFNVGLGPGGLALDAARRRLYVLNHLDATISVIDLTRRQTVQTARLRYNPTPPLVRAGRPFLYDALRTSSYGDLSCAICHVFGDMDGLAWDLGDPSGIQFDFPVRLRNTGLGEPRQSLHPLKGPLVTQSLRGLANTAPYHWRGDRYGSATKPGEDIASFKAFNPAFVDLMGRDKEISDGAMEAFARFIMTIRYPPNPLQRLDRGMDDEQKAGFEFFTGPFLSDAGEQNCVSCHALPNGTNRLVNFEGLQIGRDMKTAQLRNLYDKVGRFNVAGPQVSGFGLLHDGTVESVVGFLRFDVFFFPGDSEADKDVIRRQLHHYVMAFDTGMAPLVGRQLTVSGELADSAKQMLDLMSRRAAAGDCDLIARGWEGQTQRGWLLRDHFFQGDRSAAAGLGLVDLLARYRGTAEPVTFTCVPPGDGRRSAIDRDLDGHLDGDEINAGSDPADPRSVPGDLVWRK